MGEFINRKIVVLGNFLLEKLSLDTIKLNTYLKQINMQRSSTWILKVLGTCERWSKSDCIDLSAAFAYTLQSFSYSFNFSNASWS